MANLFTRLFGTKQSKDMKILLPVLEKVNSLSEWASSLKDEDFPKETENLKQKVSAGESLDSVLPQAFALAREASYRVLGEKHYDEQILGAIILHQGKILEMKTGEGKTLTCVPAAYLNALEGKGVHVVTVNDYLASRDAAWMGKVYKFLGLTVGVITAEMDTERRRQNYSCDITYGTNNEFGFDYLRDNMKYRFQDKIQPKHHFCIIDEIDSILIDEARTPLIISGPADDDTMLAVNSEKITQYFRECEKDPSTGDYPIISKFAKLEGTKEEPDGDFMIDEKSKRITFTKQGMLHMEELLQRHNIIHGSLYDDENFEYVHYVTQAMVARHLYKKDTDYIVSDNQIQIVDEFTGRILYGRRYSEGLHQAIEAKEHIKIFGKNRTLATITIQNFFRMYDKISGMTGTAETEAIEFQQIYGLDVVVIPTHVPVARKDNDDLVYLSEQFKLKAVCEEIKKVHETGQPILVGTISIEKSELYSSLLTKMGIKHEVLNAKNHEREAAIIANAGAVGAVTIATNMAGRGTDIKLGGSPDAMAWKVCGTDASEEEFKKAKEKIMPLWKESYNKVKELGGLYILGTERHESRRIDNQLRGRSGRQGDPGTSRFFISFDDNLLRLFAKDNIKAMLGKLGLNQGEPIEHSMVSRVIETAQKQVELRNFDIRKHLLDYDNVLNDQRNYIYSQRDSILQETNIIQRSLDACNDIADEIVEESKGNIENISLELSDKLGFEAKFSEEDAKLDSTALCELIHNQIKELIDSKVKLVGVQLFSLFVQQTYLKQIDTRWQNHLEELEALRDAVSLRSYAQKNPLTEYKVEGFEIFQSMIANIRESVAKTIIKVRIQTGPHIQERKPSRTIESHSAASSFESTVQRQIQNARQNKEGNNNNPVQVVRTMPKVGRNDPCPCGSGLKYKNCHGKNTGGSLN